MSEIVGTISELEAQMIRGEAQMRTRRLDITGMLVSSDRHFLDVIEGRTEAVDEIMSRIERHPIHRAMRILSRESTEKRKFSQWSMGLALRHDLAAELRELHAKGCPKGANICDVVNRMLGLVS